MTENQIEKLLQSWNPGKASEGLKERIWKQIQERLYTQEQDDRELSEEELAMAAGGISVKKENNNPGSA